MYMYLHTNSLIQTYNHELVMKPVQLRQSGEYLQTSSPSISQSRHQSPSSVPVPVTICPHAVSSPQLDSNSQYLSRPAIISACGGMWARLPLATPGLGAKNASSGGCSRPPIAFRCASTARVCFPLFPRASRSFPSFSLSIYFLLLYCSLSLPLWESLHDPLDPCSLSLFLLSLIHSCFSSRFCPPVILSSIITYIRTTVYYITLYIRLAAIRTSLIGKLSHIILLCPIEKGPVL